MPGPVGDAGGEPVGSRTHESTSFGMPPRDFFGGGDCTEDADAMASMAFDTPDMLESAPSASFVAPGRGVMSGKMEEARGTSVVGGPSSRGGERNITSRSELARWVPLPLSLSNRKKTIGQKHPCIAKVIPTEIRTNGCSDLLRRSQ